MQADMSDSNNTETLKRCVKIPVNKGSRSLLQCPAAPHGDVQL